ncbi:1-acyl-sn-glycerol-3-phosphate acyltransferase [Myxococcota bacterium]|nr:1-acyl-sn-glycerol-3-phosphate acyltransferase [Myxococcota bacterium]MBU1430292.1 1-acyl-sn-glycerol-3-phosphate acyltransferase [Myxococcota bacterium]MBU1896256.1 1-acyl-sn-glycerol-3-phosphate acyltransferase [Myxococcota bacterium]
MSRPRQSAAQMYLLRAIRALIRLWLWIFYAVDRQGIAHIPDEGPAILAPNHVSYIDALLIATSSRRVPRFVMHHRFMRLPGLGWVFKLARVVPIASTKDAPEVLEEAMQAIDAALDAGDLICIFPEGALTRTGEINAFRGGIERILARRPVPVIPVALRGLWGSFFSLAHGKEFGGGWHGRLRAPLGVTCGAPIPAEAVEMDALRARVATLRGEQA